MPDYVKFKLDSVLLGLMRPSKTALKDEVSNEIDTTDIKSSSSKKLLGVLIDDKLTFNGHVFKLCKKASNKLSYFLENWPTLENKPIRK